MKTLIANGAAAAAGALTLATLAAAPASAEVRQMHDPVGDGAGGGNGDVKWLRLGYGPERLRVTIKLPASGDPAYYQDLYLDTWPKHPGPEVLISTNGDWEGWSISRGGGWEPGRGVETCRSRPLAVDYDPGHHRVHYTVPRTCLKPHDKAQPPKIRASLVTRGETERAYDWVPGVRTFGRWIHWK